MADSYPLSPCQHISQQQRIFEATGKMQKALNSEGRWVFASHLLCPLRTMVRCKRQFSRVQTMKANLSAQAEQMVSPTTTHCAIFVTSPFIFFTVHSCPGVPMIHSNNDPTFRMQHWH